MVRFLIMFVWTSHETCRGWSTDKIRLQRNALSRLQLVRRISEIMKFGARAGDDPFANSHSSDEVEAPRIQVQFM